jgi:signal transduction histidine kinase
MPAPSLLPQQLVAFLEAVWSARTEAAVALMAVERAAEALDAEIAAIVCENRVVAAVGYPEGAVPVRELVLIAEDGAHHELAVPGAGVCPVDTVLLDYPLVGTFILARAGPGGGLRHDEASLLRGMARVTSMAMRTQRLLDDERAAREDSDRQAAENAQLLAALTQRQARLTELAGEQAALRRVATLVAASWGFGDQADADRIFAAVAEEAGRLLRADTGAVAKFGPAGCFTVLAIWTKPGMDFHFPVGEQLPIEEGSLSARVLRSGRPSRLDTYDVTAGRLVHIRDRFGLRSMIGAPIMVGGRVWGLVTVGVISSRSEALPAGSEQRLADFTELLATAISNAQARSELARLAEEQAALRRVATLVATGTAAEDLFEAVTIEMRMLLNAGVTSLQRYEADGTVTVLAASSDPDTEVPLLSHLTLEGRSVAAAVLSSGRAARIDELEGPPGSQPGVFRGLGMRSSAGAPIVVEGRLWGVIIAHWRDSQAAPPDAEGRIAQFTQLVATAISNAASRAQLAASRARIVVTADETRRRIERNLHDGIQQRLVTVALRLRTAQDTDLAEHAALLAAMSQAGDELVSILDELREISRGVHPAILSQGGLGPALRSLTRRASVPTVLDIDEIGRLPQPVEVASYYVVSEALTNAAKHAHATVVHVNLRVTDTTLRLSIDDDGDGGADPAQGSGIIGLIDRVEALGGKLTLRSPPGEGTSLVIELPLEPSSRSSPAQGAPGGGDQGAGDLLRGQ